MNKKAQLSLTNPRDACEKFARNYWLLNLPMQKKTAKLNEAHDVRLERFKQKQYTNDKRSELLIAQGHFMANKLKWG